MVVDLKKLSEALRQSSPEDDMRQDLERIIRAEKPQIDEALASGKSYWLRVPDGRHLRISPRQPVLASALEPALQSTL
jgi:hypothetical protein